MKLLLVAATRQEVELLLERIGAVPGESIQYKNISVYTLITGVGMVATAFHLGAELRNKYQLAINLGLAGSFNRHLSIGEVVNVHSDCLSELGAEDDQNWLRLEEMNLEGKSEFTNPTSFQNSIIDVIPKVSGITVNMVHGNTQSIETVYNRFHPYVESMEGAAFLYACEQVPLPCLQLRAISNYVEKRNREAWNIPLAIQNLNKKALEIIDSL
jgi:futalosine hydrolase